MYNKYLYEYYSSIANDFDALQISPKYKSIHYGGHDYEFDDWNRDALIDGWVCRNDSDCTWIDERLGCNDYGFQLNQIKVIYIMDMNINCCSFYIRVIPQYPLRT